SLLSISGDFDFAVVLSVGQARTEFVRIRLRPAGPCSSDSRSWRGCCVDVVGTLVPGLSQTFNSVLEDHDPGADRRTGTALDSFVRGCQSRLSQSATNAFSGYLRNLVGPTRGSRASSGACAFGDDLLLCSNSVHTIGNGDPLRRACVLHCGRNHRTLPFFPDRRFVLSHGMTIEALCPKCGKANEFETEDKSFMLSCHSCGNPFGSMSGFVSQKGEVNHCGICGCRDLYIQKDFSRVVGCTIAAIGAILAPFTRFLSLLVAAL